ncbi:MAG: 2-hydroxycarboxylate transporter family protein [Planctomycetaceae bacterium]|nr:2-hydroxycarboxylate transporter family protein [Planctomycetaceae bacterium]
MTSISILEHTEARKAPAFQIYGMAWPYFAIFTAVVLSAIFLGKLPEGMVGAFPIMIILGAVFNLIGDKTPVISTFLGGGAIVAIFGSAALSTFGLLPEVTITTMTQFMKGGGFLDFYIASLITGSIMGMNRKLLIKAALRYLPVIVGGVAVSLAAVAVCGALTGYGAQKAVFFVAIPIMGGGMGAGAVPLAKIFGEGLATDPAAMLSVMVPAVALGNALAIICGGLLNRLGERCTSLSGNGRLMVMEQAGTDNQAAQESKDAEKREPLDLTRMGAGLLVATSFFALGSVLNYIFPAVHGYAWMILSVAVVKASGLLPQKFETCCYQWFQFVMNNLTGVLLVGIGIAYTNLNEVAAAFSPQYLLLVSVTVFGAIIGAGLMGRIVGFFAIEASITGGLCMANMGGTGDVAVLSAAKRMELMPFAQVSSRIGGAFMLILSSIIIQLWV